MKLFRLCVEEEHIVDTPKTLSGFLRIGTRPYDFILKKVCAKHFV